MKDLQTRKRSADPYIPLVSPILHVMSLTVVVWLRRGFGFSYLRPLSIVGTITWVHLLFTVYALHTPTVWQRWGGFCLFGIFTAALYAGHYLFGFFKETAKKGSHDQHSGDSWLLCLLKAESKEKSAVILQVVAEPLLVLGVALLIGRGTFSSPISIWLKWAGYALFVKEGINYWYMIRGLKRTSDVKSDAEGLMVEGEARRGYLRNEGNQVHGAGFLNLERDSAERGKRTIKYAQLLKMQPPYTVEKARQSFKELGSVDDPRLIEALSFFESC